MANIRMTLLDLLNKDERVLTPVSSATGCACSPKS